MTCSRVHNLKIFNFKWNRTGVFRHTGKKLRQERRKTETKKDMTEVRQRKRNKIKQIEKNTEGKNERKKYKYH